MQYSVHAAKTHLSKLIEAAERGEEVVIARGDKPVVKLTPVGRKEATFGLLAGLKNSDPNDWFQTLPDDELRQWEGGGVA